MIFNLCDLFCGAGGASKGSEEALILTGHTPFMRGVNHNKDAIETYKRNHPGALTHNCGVDQVKASKLYTRTAGERKLHGLWASPSCVQHSKARTPKEIDDQDRISAWCIIRWAEEVAPPFLLVENVVEWLDWAPLDQHGRPDKKRKGEVFKAWVHALEAAGYIVEWKVLTCADYGDPTSRERLFVQAVNRYQGYKIVWPEPTHSPTGEHTLEKWPEFHGYIEWDIPGKSIFEKNLVPNTLERIYRGLEKQPVLEPFIAILRGTAPRQLKKSAMSTRVPLPTVSAGGVHAALIEPMLLPQHGGGVLRSSRQPMPTIAGAAAVALIEPYLVSYYGTGGPKSTRKPIGTMTTNDRYALIRPTIMSDGVCYQLDILHRMITIREAARAQGFHDDFEFVGNSKAVKKQIGNAVPRRTARSLMGAVVAQDSRVHFNWINN